ncbi:MAG: glycosyltransferase family 9 protein, partial [Calditrichota bacterium]
LKRVKKFEKILVLSDLNIGDAINVQAACSAFRTFFPGAEIDYVINCKAANIIDGNPEISNVYPLYSGTPLPNAEDYQKVYQLLNSKPYDVIFNFCPFFKESGLLNSQQAVINVPTIAYIMLKNENKHIGINHISYQIYSFLSELLSIQMGKKASRSFPGTTLTIPGYALNRAKIFLETGKIKLAKPVVLVNPDANSKYTKIPFESMVLLLKKLSKIPCRIILGRGITFPGIESELLSTVSPPCRRKITLVPPDMSVGEYTALLDFVDVYITGDTGPLHMAAARKFSQKSRMSLRNKTAIFSIFGATPARMYGYDSSNPLFLPANQDAPSHIYIAGSRCRNVTCINKMAKTCKTVHCFETLDVDVIVRDIRKYLDNLAVGHEIQKSYYPEVEEIMLKG